MVRTSRTKSARTKAVPAVATQDIKPTSELFELCCGEQPTETMHLQVMSDGFAAAAAGDTTSQQPQCSLEEWTQLGELTAHSEAPGATQSRSKVGARLASCGRSAAVVPSAMPPPLPLRTSRSIRATTSASMQASGQQIQCTQLKAPMQQLEPSEKVQPTQQLEPTTQQLESPTQHLDPPTQQLEPPIQGLEERTSRRQRRCNGESLAHPKKASNSAARTPASVGTGARARKTATAELPEAKGAAVCSRSGSDGVGHLAVAALATEDAGDGAGLYTEEQTARVYRQRGRRSAAGMSHEKPPQREFDVLLMPSPEIRNFVAVPRPRRGQPFTELVQRGLAMRDEMLGLSDQVAQQAIADRVHCECALGQRSACGEPDAKRQRLAASSEAQQHYKKELAESTQLDLPGDVGNLAGCRELVAACRSSPDAQVQAAKDGADEDGCATQLGPTAMTEAYRGAMSASSAGSHSEQSVLDAVRGLLHRGGGEAEVTAVVRGMLQAGFAEIGADGVASSRANTVGNGAVSEAVLEASSAKAVNQARSFSKAASDLGQRVRSSARPLALLGGCAQGTPEVWEHAARPAVVEAQLVPYTSGLEGVEAALLDLQMQEDEARAVLAAFVSDKIGRVQQTLSVLQQRKDAVSGVLDALQNMV